MMQGRPLGPIVMLVEDEVGKDTLGNETLGNIDGLIYCRFPNIFCILCICTGPWSGNCMLLLKPNGICEKANPGACICAGR